MKKLSSISSWLILSLYILIPLFFLPITQDFYDTNKWSLLLIITLLLILISSIRTIWDHSHCQFSLTPETIGFSCLSAASLISLIFVSSNRVEAAISPFGLATFLSLSLIHLLLPPLLTEKQRSFLKLAVTGLAAIAGIIALYQFFGIGKRMLPSAQFLADALWTPTGYISATITLFLCSLPLLVSGIRQYMKENHESYLAIFSVLGIVVLAGLGLTLIQFMPKISSTLLTQTDGWFIFLEIFKNLKHSLVGFGAENFLSAFSTGKRMAYNTSAIWNIRFTMGSNLLFHIGTIYGLSGILALLIAGKSIIRRQEDLSLFLSISICIFMMLITPPNIASLVLLSILLLASAPHTEKQHMRTIHSSWVKYTLFALAIVLVTGSGYGLYRITAAEMVFGASLKTARANNGTGTYNHQVKSIQLNKYIGKYHIIYSQTNLALASSLASAIGQPDNKSTDEQKTKDRELVAQLVQQAIREAKLATTLNPESVLAWENLARIYNQLIGVAQGADTWSETSFKRAIALDPANPILRLELGSIALKKKNYTDAITNFQKSASLKPNYANAYYNLANAYNQSGDPDSALRALRETQTLLDTKSADYESVTREIERLKNPKAVESTSSAETQNRTSNP